MARDRKKFSANDGSIMRAVIYCRVSTKEQTQNLSLPTQQRACFEYCERNGFAVERVFVEEGESAKTADRPKFKEMLSLCREQKGILTHVVVYNLSRFARSKTDHFAIRALLLGYGITLRSVTEPIDDTSTGKLMEGVLSAFAQFDNDVRADRTKAGMQAALEAGRWTFKAPLGYRRGLDLHGKSTLAIDEVSGPLVRKAFEIYATGAHTKREVLRIVTDLGLRTQRGKRVSFQTFDKLLANPIYAGWLTVRSWGEPYRGAFPAIVSEELFGIVQALLTGRKIPAVPHTRNHPDFPLRHFVQCGSCDRPLTGSWSKGRGGRYAYYRCPNGACKGVNHRKERMEQAFVELLNSVQPKRECLALFREIVLDVWERRKRTHHERVESLRRQESQLQERKRRLVDAFVYRQAIDQKTYEDEGARISEEIALNRIEAHEAQLEELDVEGTLAFAEHLLLHSAQMWTQFSLAQKQRCQRVFFPFGLRFSDGRFGTPQINSAFSWLRECEGEKTNLASLTIPSWNQLVNLLQDLNVLRAA